MKISPTLLFFGVLVLISGCDSRNSQAQLPGASGVQASSSDSLSSGGDSSKLKGVETSSSTPALITDDDDERWFYYRAFEMYGKTIHYSCSFSKDNPGEVLARSRSAGDNSFYLRGEVKQNEVIVAVDIVVPDKGGSIKMIRGEKRCESLVGALNAELKRQKDVQDAEGKALSEKYK